MNEIVEIINGLNPTEIATNSAVRDQFIGLYNEIWKSDKGESVYENEVLYFTDALNGIIAQIMKANEKYNTEHRVSPEQAYANAMNSIDKFSVYVSFREICFTDLSLEPGANAQAYLTARNTNTIGTDGKAVWKSRISYVVSGYGELIARKRAGQIKYVDNPVVVYENDDFSVADHDGKKVLDYKCNLPHEGKRIKACYMRITRGDGSVDYSVMLQEDWQRLAGFSLKQNQRRDSKGNVYGSANALYTSNAGQIDTGFLIAKCVKHAFKMFEKVRIGRMAVMSGDDDIANNIMATEAPQIDVVEPWSEPQAKQATQIAVVSGGVKVQADDDIF